MRKPVSEADSAPGRQGAGAGMVLTSVCQPVSVLAPHFLPGGCGEQRVVPAPLLTHRHPPLLVPFPRTHLLLLPFLERHPLVTAGTRTTTGTSIPNRMATKLDASGVRATERRDTGQEGIGEETLSLDPKRPSRKDGDP